MGVRTRVRVRFLFALLVLGLLPLPLFARTHLAGYVEQGGQRHLNSGIYAITRSSATQTNPYSMQSYPNATVTVYLTGTLTTATLYSDSSGTAKTNPFTASSNAYWSFYVDNGIYDIRFSGGGITTPYTWSAIATSGESFTVPVTGLGAVCDGVTDDTVAIQAALSILNPHKVILPDTHCLTTSQLLIDQHGIVVEGQGQRISGIKFAPTANASAIKIQLATFATVISQVELRQFRIYSADTTFAKTAIDIVDGSETLVEDMMIGPSGQWTGGASISPFTGSGSIGIRIRGREFGSFHRNLVFADIPLRVSANPNGTISIDHHVFDDESYWSADEGNPNVLLDSGINLTNVAFRDMGMVSGSYGIYWNDTTSTEISSNLTAENIRIEQLESGGMYYIHHNTLLYGLNISNQTGGTGTNVNGIEARTVSQLVVDGFFYRGDDECVDADTALDWRSSLCQSNSTANLNTMVEVGNSTGFFDGLSPMPFSGKWVTPHALLTAGQCSRFMGVYQCAKTGTLADGATVAIPSLGGGLVTGKIDITFAGATLNGAFSCTINAARTVRNWTSDSTIADCTGNVAGDITVHWSSASSIVLRNNLGEAVTYNWLLTLN